MNKFLLDPDRGKVPDPCGSGSATLINMDYPVFRLFPAPSLSWTGIPENGTVRDTVFPMFLVNFPPYSTLPVQVTRLSTIDK